MAVEPAVVAQRSREEYGRSTMFQAAVEPLATNNSYKHMIVKSLYLLIVLDRLLGGTF